MSRSFSKDISDPDHFVITLELVPGSEYRGPGIFPELYGETMKKFWAILWEKKSIWISFPGRISTPSPQSLPQRQYVCSGHGYRKRLRCHAQAIEKSVSRDVGANTIALCRTAGIEPEIGFLMFVADSTLDNLENNFRFLEQNRLLDRFERTANLLCHRQIVLMGTLGCREFMRQGRLIPSGHLGFQGQMDVRTGPLCLPVGSPANFQS